MRQYGKMWNRWRRTLCFVCSLALVLSNVPAVPVFAEESAGQEALLDGTAEGTETLGEGETEDGTEENGQNPDEPEEAVPEPPEIETGIELGLEEDTEDSGMDDGDEVTDGEAADSSGQDTDEDENEDEDAEDSGPGIEEMEEDGVAEAAMLFSLDLSYTDAQGNVFTYVVDADGNATITGITLSGQALTIPGSINGATVAAVSNGNNACVLSNPETPIPSLYINCGIIGARAFAGVHAGTLTIGEDVARFAESSDSDVSAHYWNQFAGAQVGKLCFYSRNAEMGHTSGMGLSNHMYGPFEGAAVGELEIGTGVGKIPEYLLYGAAMDIDELTLQMPEVGAYAFASSGITIGTLTIGSGVSLFKEDYYSDVAAHYWRQFAGVNVGKLRFESTSLAIEHRAGIGLHNNMYGPFEGATVGELEIGTGVGRIPEYLLYGAAMDIDELTLQMPEVGAYAFASPGISIGTLTIGSGVSLFKEDYYSDVAAHYWRQFAGVNVGKLRFESTSLAIEHRVDIGLHNNIYGPFEGAAVGELEIGTGVGRIPEYLLYNAVMDIDELTLQMPEIGAYAFASPEITIGTLTIGSGVSLFQEDHYSDVSAHYWRQFAGANVGKLRFESASLAIGHRADIGLHNNIYGPFEGAAVGELEIGTGVGRIPEYLLYGAAMEIDGLTLQAPEIGAYAFASPEITIGTLTIGSGVECFAEDYYSSSTAHYWDQFAGVTVGVLRLYAPDLKTGHTKGMGVSNTIFPPFEGAAVGELEIGAGVGKIPEYFLHKASMGMDALEIQVPEIGAYAFASPEITIGTLTLGSSVEVFKEDSFSTTGQHYWNQFAGVTVGVLRLYALDLRTGHTLGTGVSNNIYPPFEKARVGSLEIGAGVGKIPEYFLYKAAMGMDELEIQVPEIGSYAFASPEITFGTLTLGSGVELFTEDSFSTTGQHYWNQFAGVAVGILRLYAPDLETKHRLGVGVTNSIYPPFEGAKVGSLEIGAGVDAVPELFLYKAVLQMGDAGLDIHTPEIGAYAFAGSGISIGTLTIGKEVSLFRESYFSTSLYHYWNQFMDSRIGHVVYAADSARTVNNVVSYGSSTIYIYGPFQRAEAGALTITDNVECIPDYFFYNAKASLDELALDVPLIGALAFMGNGISIKRLTIGENVECFARAAYSTTSSRYWRQFCDADIGTVDYRAVSACLDGFAAGATYYYSPFYRTGIDRLALGDSVDRIPDYFFHEAILAQEELAVHARVIGVGAFYSPNLSVGKLTVGDGVEEFACMKSGSSNYYYRQFAGAKITELSYEAAEAVTGKNGTSGPFDSAEIGSVSFGGGVAAVPDYLLYNAKTSFGDFTLNIPKIGCYSFAGSTVSFGDLAIGEDVAVFSVNAGNKSFAFNGCTVSGRIIYGAADARLDTSVSNAYGPFYNTAADRMVIAENVEYLDRRLLRGNSFGECTVYAVEASEEYAGQTLTASYLPSSTNLSIHHNSGFAPYFTAKAQNTDWMCEDFFTVTYGNKVYDEGLGGYRVEVMRECSVCGYTEGGMEEPDDTYEVYLSIPVEVPLSFSGSTKSYGGSGTVYAYGRLGNAYDGVKVSVDSEAGDYGSATAGTEEIDISPYLTVGFRSGGEALFTPAQLLGNAKTLANGGTGELYTDSLAVSVKGTAFLRSGAGEYAIPIPLRIEIF